MPPADEARRAGGWLIENAPARGVDTAELLASFTGRTDRFLDLLDGFMPEAAWLTDAETLTYLHSTISTRRQRVRVPEVPMHLDAVLADEPLLGGLAPRLGPMHLRTLTILGLPSTTWPGLLDELNGQAFEYRLGALIDVCHPARYAGRTRSHRWLSLKHTASPNPDRSARPRPFPPAVSSSPLTRRSCPAESFAQVDFLRRDPNPTRVTLGKRSKAKRLQIGWTTRMTADRAGVDEVKC